VPIILSQKLEMEARDDYLVGVLAYSIANSSCLRLAQQCTKKLDQQHVYQNKQLQETLLTTLQSEMKNPSLSRRHTLTYTFIQNKCAIIQNKCA